MGRLFFMANLKKIAIIGAGFSGLSVCWHLLTLSQHQIILFDDQRGASSIATGLVHPYPGQDGKKSWRAEEGLKMASLLFDVAEDQLKKIVVERGGIYRLALNEAVKKNLSSYSDVEKIADNYFLIRSGMTVFAPLYLEGLWEACRKRGAVKYPVSVHSLSSLADFDCIVLASGAQTMDFGELYHAARGIQQLPLRKVKGQVLICRGNELEKSLIGKGYVAKTATAGVVQWGATYEKNFSSEEASMREAYQLLKPKMDTFLPYTGTLEVQECKAAIRMVVVGHYLPLALKISDKVWTLTGMGSRGLLYHALLGKILAEAILANEEELIPTELRRRKVCL